MYELLPRRAIASMRYALKQQKRVIGDEEVNKFTKMRQD